MRPGNDSEAARFQGHLANRVPNCVHALVARPKVYDIVMKAGEIRGYYGSGQSVLPVIGRRSTEHRAQQREEIGMGDHGLVSCKVRLQEIAAIEKRMALISSVVHHQVLGPE